MTTSDDARATTIAQLDDLLRAGVPSTGHDPAATMEACRECPHRTPTNEHIRHFGPSHPRGLGDRICKAGDGRGTCRGHAAAGACPIGRFPHQVAARAAEMRVALRLADAAAGRPYRGPLGEFFARVYVINLARKPDRLARFWRDFPTDWPFPRPERWDAFDGHNRGGGAWGCRQSWLGILDRVIADGVDRPILVLEDDCQFVGDARTRFADLVANLPGDWELAAPGVHHIGGRGEQVAPGVVRCKSWDRTHAVMIHPRFFTALRDFWRAESGHIDHNLNKWAKEPARRFYAADPVFAIQCEGWSDINGRFEPKRSWDGRVSVANRRAADVPVVLLRSPRRVVDQLRLRGLIHTGYWRDGEGRDRGLCDAVARPPGERAAAIATWIRQWGQPEAAAFPNAACALWHDGIDERTMREAWPAATIVNVDRAEDFAPGYPNAQHFAHSGKFGDILAALPTIRAMGGGTLHLNPWANVGMAMTPAHVENIGSLLRVQPYIKACVYAHPRPGHARDLNNFRRHWKSGRSIADHHLIANGLPVAERDTAWLSVPDPTPVARVVIARSPRYWGRSFPWGRVVARYGKEAAFVGSPKEHAAFVARFGHVPHHPTADMLALARVIAGAELFVGNQSSPLWIAEGLKMPVVQEVWHADANVRHDRPNAIHGWNDKVELP